MTNTYFAVPLSISDSQHIDYRAVGYVQHAAHLSSLDMPHQVAHRVSMAKPFPTARTRRRERVEGAWGHDGRGGVEDRGRLRNRRYIFYTGRPRPITYLERGHTH